MDSISQIILDSFYTPQTVTVLMPTRGRPKLLFDAVESLKDTAWKPDDIDIQVAVDNDDTETLDMLPKLGKITVSVGENVGYCGTASRHNEMFRKSQGEFLLLYADDARMNTDGWDEIIRGHRNQICIPFTLNEDTCFIHRSIPEVWGKLTPYYCAEIIYKLIALELGIYIRYDEIIVTHVPVDAQGRDRGVPMPPDGWFMFKDEIYSLTDSMKPHVSKIESKKPLEKHPINDIGRGKIYYGGSTSMPPCIG